MFRFIWQVQWFYLSAGKNLAEGATEPPEKAGELMYARRWRHVDTAHNLYELRKAGANRWKVA